MGMPHEESSAALTRVCTQAIALLPQHAACLGCRCYVPLLCMGPPTVSQPCFMSSQARLMSRLIS